MFIWDDKLNTDFVDIDMQHQDIFSIANNILWLATYEDVISINILKAKEKLKNHALLHFNTETQYLLVASEIGLISEERVKEHLKQHENFKEQFQKLSKAHEEEADLEFLDRMVNFIYSWLTAHIENYDLDLKAIEEKENFQREIRKLRFG